MSSVTIATIPESVWEGAHELNPYTISVTQLIQFIGWGYESRIAMFSEGEKKEKSEYLKRAIEHGNKYEREALSLLSTEETVILPAKHTSCLFKDVLMGTVDSYCWDPVSLEMGIVEIKCRYSNSFGRFVEEEVDVPFEKNKNNWKHWLQLQLYLHMHQEYGITYGLLCYFYKKGTADNNGESILQVNRIKYEPLLWDGLCLDKEIKSYFEEYLSGKKKAGPVRKSKFITETLITTTLVQRRKLLG